MLTTTMVAGYYDTNEMYNRGPCMEYYGPDTSYGLQDSCAPLPCVYHAAAAAGSMRMLAPPGGHIVQQVVDENGTLHHLVLSPVPIPPIPYAPGGSPGQPAGYYPSYPPTYPTPPCPQFLPVPCNVPPLISSSHKAGSPDDRRQYLRHKKKLESRQQQQQHNGWLMLSPSSSSCSSASSMSSQSSTPQPGEGCRKRHRNGVAAPPPDPTRGEELSVDPSLEKGLIHTDEAEVKFITKILSSIQAPTVSEVATTSALVQWLYPDLGTNLPLLYEVLLADSDCSQGHYKIAYSGSQSEYRLQHLTPNTTYHVSVQAFCSDLRGSPSPEVTFSTLPLATTKPARPLPPKLLSRTKTSLTLRWTGPSSRSSASKMCAFVLEWDEGSEDRGFSELYRGQQRQFKVAKLLPGAPYHFRLALISDLGESDWSEVVQFHTCPPTAVAVTSPAISPPSLTQASRDSLLLEWVLPVSGCSLVLQMETSPGNWRQIYSGLASQFLCTHLLPDTSYRFRLGGEGEGWSRAVTFSTMPQQLPAPLVVGFCGDQLELDWPDFPSLEDVRLEMDSGNGFEVVSVGDSRKLTNLQPGTKYRLRLVSGDLVSEETSISTPGPPKLQRIPSNSPHSDGSSLPPISLTWAGSSPEVSQYEVEMRLGGGQPWCQVYKGEAACCDINQYPAGSDLAFRARALSPLGPWSEPLVVETGPPAPTACRAVPTSPHTAALSWHQPSSETAAAACFRLEWSPHPPESFQQVYQGPNPCYNMCGLAPASQYHFRVQALSRSGLGGLYSPHFSCQTPAGPPGMVSAGSVECQATSHSLELSWSAPEDTGGSPILGYLVRLGEQEHSTERPSLLLDQLSPHTAYCLTLCAFNTAGCGEPCSPIRLETLDLPPEPPALLECSTASHGSLRLRWSPSSSPQSAELTYVLEMGGGKPGSFVPVYQGPATQHKISRLQENCPYHFRVCASHPTLGTGPFSTVATFRTAFAPPPPLKGPRLTEVTDTSCQVDWSPVKCPDPLSYQLQLISRSSDAYNTVYQGQSHCHHLSSLEPGKVYLVRVAAVRHLPTGKELCGPFSAATAFSTQPAPRLPRSDPVPSASLQTPYTLSDQQYAFLILVAFTTFSCLLATLLQGILGGEQH